MSLVRMILKSYLAVFRCSTAHSVLMLFLREIKFSFLQSWVLELEIDSFFVL